MNAQLVKKALERKLEESEKHRDAQDLGTLDFAYWHGCVQATRYAVRLMK